MKSVQLNAGAQTDFVGNKHRLSGYIGGLGSGKTFAGIARGLTFAQQPKPSGAFYGSRGLCGAISYPVLKDVVLPQFFELVEGTGLLKDYIRSEKKAILTNGAEVLFRSLENPDVIRGVELSWFFIDEGRHLSRYAFDVALGRLRQPGFTHAGWVCSTPNGYDWMWEVFHPDSPKQYDDSVWFNAPTYENRNHLPDSYIKSLEATYEGKFFEQEVLGKFVGIVSGAVFPHWNSTLHTVKEVQYRPDLPLYSFWDFGVGDPGVCLFAQLDWEPKALPSGGTEFVPVLYFLDYIEAQDWTSEDWAHAWYSWLEENTERRKPEVNVGDPAGKQRNAVSGTSVIDDLASRGIHVIPAPKRPQDYAIRILDNMMAGSRVLVDGDRCARLAAAFATHKWPTDDNGQRVGNKPVHDWTSHFCDAARYGATHLLTHFPRRAPAPQREEPGPGTMGWLLKKLDEAENTEGWIGHERPGRVDWTPPSLGVRNA